MSDFDHEPVRGLPQALPEGEHILWQGSPDWRTLARRGFHVRKFALYFGLLLLWRAVTRLADGGSGLDALVAVAWLVPLPLIAIGILACLAWLVSRNAVYTITNRRIVLRIGIVLTMALNLPFRVIDSAGLRLHRDGTADIPLQLLPGQQIAYLHLWPHARPWRFARSEPMLRCVPDGQAVAQILAGALAAAIGQAAQEPSNAPADRATRPFAEGLAAADEARRQPARLLTSAS